MKAIKMRPFAFSCCLFLLSSFLLFFVPLWVKITALSAASVSAIILLLVRKKGGFSVTYLIMPLIISSALSIGYFSLTVNNILSYDGAQCETEFIILDNASLTEDSSSYTVLVTRINGNKAHFKARLYFPSAFDLQNFSSHKADLSFSRLDYKQNGVDTKYSFISDGIYLSAFSKEDISTVSNKIRLFPDYYFKKANLLLSSLFDSHLSGEENGLIQALILGNRHKLSDSTTSSFRRLGLSHMLAVSGMHLSILIGSIGLLLEKTRLGKRKQYLLMIFITLFYAGITGFSPSVKRAAIMLILYYAFFLVSKSNDSITSLCASAALICLLSPSSLFDIGLWLSFFSTYGILAAATPIGNKLASYFGSLDGVLPKLLLKLLSALLYSIIPVAFSLPVTWLSFGELALMSPFSNLLFTPILLCIMYISPVLLVLAAFPYLSTALALISSFSASLMLYLSDTLADNAPIISLKYAFVPYTVVFLIVCFVAIALTPTKKRGLYLIPIAMVPLVFCIGIPISNKASFDTQKIVYTTTKEGDSFLVISQNKGLICDISGMSPYNASSCKYYLNERCLTSLEAYIITDYTADGRDTLEWLSSAAPIQKLYLPKTTTRDDGLLMEIFLEYAAKNGIEAILYEPYRADPIDFHGVKLDIRVLSPEIPNSPASVSVSLATKDKTFNYIGLGCYTETVGKKHLTDLFSKSDNFIFGSYGKEKSLPVTTLFHQINKTLFFPSMDVFNVYKNTVPPKSTLVYFDTYYIYLTK